jgi:hypothetical protein
MKWFVVFALFCEMAWPQTETGTVVVFIVSQNGITVAADSRIVDALTRKHDDTGCKIRAFGNEFFFAAAGTAGHIQDAAGSGWSSYADAKHAWQHAQKLAMVSSAQRMTDDVAKEWAESMKEHLNKYERIKPMRDLMHGNNLGSALFGGTNAAGELGVTRADLTINLALFDSRQIVQLSSDTVELPDLHDGGTLGLGEIAAQNMRTTYAAIKQRHDLSPSAQDAEIARKLVELSIDLHPRREMLGRPVDELRLSKGAGITWISLKDNCKKKD